MSTSTVTHPPVGQRHNPLKCPLCGRWAQGHMLPCRCDVARLLIQQDQLLAEARRLARELGHTGIVDAVDRDRLGRVDRLIFRAQLIGQVVAMRVVPKPEAAPAPLRAIDEQPRQCEACGNWLMGHERLGDLCNRCLEGAGEEAVPADVAATG